MKHIKKLSMRGMTTKRESKKLNDYCPNCKHFNIIWDTSSGELVCTNCGLVISGSCINTGPEWNKFPEGLKNTGNRAGLPIKYSISDKGLSTLIINNRVDLVKLKVSEENRSQLFRIVNWHNRLSSYNYQEKSLDRALYTIKTISITLHLPSFTVEQAALIFRKAMKKKLIRGRSVPSLACAALYIACRIHNIPRSLDEFKGSCPDVTLDIAHCVRLLVKELSLHLPPPDSTSNIPVMAQRANITLESQHIAMNIMRKAKCQKITAGKSPTSLAAAALYLACLLNKEKMTQKTLAEASGVTEVTIRNRYKEFINTLDLTSTLEL